MGPGGKEQEVGVYAHVPFCKKKCPYCDFKSMEAARVPEDRFAGCLLSELRCAVDEHGLGGARLSTVYLGGGTPSILSPEAVGRIIGSVKASFRPVEGAEVTLEVNPDTVDLAKLAAFREAGATRLSIGFQAMDDRHLVLLGRAHTAEAALRAFSDAVRAGFTNVGIDLMFAIPGQTLADWAASLDRAVSLAPQHISLYGLTIEEGTPFHGRFVKGGAGLPGEDDEARMYLMAMEALTRAGYVHYEVSNFCLPGFESRHNSRYWKGADYIGIGPSAHSYLSGGGWGERWWNVASASEYMDRVERGESPVESREELTREEAMMESVMLGLRMVGEGLVAGPFRQRFGLSPQEALCGWEGLVDEGLLVAPDDGLRLTGKGCLFLNEALLRISPRRL